MRPILLSFLCVTALALTTSAKAKAPPAPRAAFVPAEIWPDTSGHPINAHGGGILFHEGIYYWYGEYKRRPDRTAASGPSASRSTFFNAGVNCYSSTDLYNWKHEAIALPTRPDEPQHDLFIRNVIERPKVIYNAKTKKFVMWLHLDSPDYQAARSAVAVSDTPTGPFTYLGSFRPNAGHWPLNVTKADKKPSEKNLLERDHAGGQMARDMTLFVDDDGTAYQFYASESNRTMHVSQLSDDYLKPAGRYSRILIGRSSEAPAVFKRNGHYYLITSGCTGWDANPARSAVADHIFGPWTELGNPCVGTNADKTFTSQSTFILPVPGRADTYIALFDRWNKHDLPDSRYICLPLEFTPEGHPRLKWHDHWTLP